MFSGHKNQLADQRGTLSKDFSLHNAEQAGIQKPVPTLLTSMLTTGKSQTKLWNGAAENFTKLPE